MLLQHFAITLTHRFLSVVRVKFVARKLGSNLGPFTAEYRVKPWSGTQNQAKRINNMGYWLLLRDQGPASCFQCVVSGIESDLGLNKADGF